jgi:hypothetical protein
MLECQDEEEMATIIQILLQCFNCSLRVQSGDDMEVSSEIPWVLKMSPIPSG